MIALYIMLTIKPLTLDCKLLSCSVIQSNSKFYIRYIIVLILNPSLLGIMRAIKPVFQTHLLLYSPLYTNISYVGYLVRPLFLLFIA